jgi:hypothetical protein
LRPWFQTSCNFNPNRKNVILVAPLFVLGVNFKGGYFKGDREGKGKHCGRRVDKEEEGDGGYGKVR